MKKMDRRTLLRGAGGVALGLPFLSAMMERTARAQAASMPTRLLILYNTQGVLMDQWAPTGSATNYTFGPILQQLDEHKQDMVVLTGIDDATCLLNRVNAHERGPAHLLTGKRMLGESFRTAGSASLDHVIADRISPAELAIKSIHLGANNPVAEISFTGPQAPVDRINDPRQAYNLLFSGFTPPDPGGGGGPDPAVERAKQRRQLVLDSVKDEIARVNRQLGAEDKQQLDAYLTRIGEIERRIGAGTSPPPPSAMCEPRTPSLMRSPSRTRPQPNGYHPYYDPDVSSRAMMDIVTQAFACDRTRVITLAWHQPNVYEWVRDSQDRPIVVDDWHQDVVHVGGGTIAQPTTPQRDYLFNVQRYYHAELNYMLASLKGVVEGDGTLLDHTLVVYVNEFSDGARHNHLGKPYFLAGKAGGRLQTGRWLSFNSVPHNRLHLSILRVFGFDDAVFGEPDYCNDGPLTGLV